MMTNQNVRSKEVILRRQVQRMNRGRSGIVSPSPVVQPDPSTVSPPIPTITAITPTGDRPLPFGLCRKWIFHQTVKPNQWIVVDDGKIPCKWLDQNPPELSGMIEYVRREPQPDDPPNTLARNLKAAIPFVTGDKIIIIEDDDYYASGYIEEMSRRLDQNKIVGIMKARYYHIMSGGYMTMNNTKHASLSQTAFRKVFMPELKYLLACKDEYLDLTIWREFGDRALLFVDADKSLYLGIKGLPGRRGIGIGHRTAIYQTIDTPGRPMLKRWVPKDYQIYLDILSGELTENNYKEYFGETAR